jgi:hypothetical protein
MGTVDDAWCGGMDFRSVVEEMNTVDGVVAGIVDGSVEHMLQET